MGAALRDRHAYYITEFDLGYSMLVVSCYQQVHLTFVGQSQRHMGVVCPAVWLVPSLISPTIYVANPNTSLQFPSARSLNYSEPKSIVTLPYPFHGTDNTVFNGTAYYNYGDMLIAYNIKTGETKELRLNISAVGVQPIIFEAVGVAMPLMRTCLEYAL